MKIDKPAGKTSSQRAAQAGFTLIEVAFAAAIAALVVAGMFEGYNVAGRRAQFSACNLAANAAAMSELERVMSAKWIPSENDNALLTQSGTNQGNLCLPSANGNVIDCKTITTITTYSVASAPYAMIQVQCIWNFPTYGGTYTNTIAVLRGPT
jgi:prepilin-type N-terminal cleavage/methylation domain-containing protein